MKEKEKENKTQEKEEKKAGKALEEALAKIASLEEEVKTWKDKTYRTLADCDNLRKSYEKDHQLMVKYRGQPFIEKLLPTLDSFYLVLKNEPSDPMLKGYLVGFQMIYNSMISELESEGVKQIIPSLGSDFDHNLMQAVDIEEGEEDDKIVSLSKPGYLLRDRLIRPAMVVVSKVKKDEKIQEVKEENEVSDEKSEEKGE